MKVWGVTPAQLERIVTVVSDAHYEGNLVCDGDPHYSGKTANSAVNFKLRVTSSYGPGHRLGFARTSRGNRRRLPSACWHAHRDVMLALFDQFPGARLKSSQADYQGAESFLQSFKHTGDRNVGSMMEPVAFKDLCECEHEEVRV